MNSRKNLIQDLVDGGYLKTPAIIKAFEKINRADFVPSEIKTLAFIDEALPIGHNQTISQPAVVAFMLELLDPKPGDKILDIGAGSGWQTALLAHIVGAKGKIIAIEKVLPLKAMTEENVNKYGFIEKGIAKVIWANAVNGYAAEAPYNKIIAAASAEKIPPAWKDQLKIGGCIVAPVNDSIVVINKVGADEFKEKEYFGFRFVPLVCD